MWINKIIKNFKNEIIKALFTEKFKTKIIDDLIENVDLPAFDTDTERKIYIDLINAFENRLKKG